MTSTIILDAGPLGLVTNPKRTTQTIVAAQWIFDLEAAGCRILVPAIADYEVRRELVRAQKSQGIARLNSFNAAAPGRFLSMTDTALVLAADLWAHARNSGNPTAGNEELDADVLIAAQALDVGLSADKFVVATVNVGHLSLFVPADLWSNIIP